MVTERHSGDGQESSSSSAGRRGIVLPLVVVVVVVVEDVERFRRTSRQKHPQIFLGRGAVVVHGRIAAPGHNRRGRRHVVVVVVVVT